MNIFGKAPCPEYTPPEPPKFARFCSVCGKPLVPEIEHVYFDSKTGCPVFKRWLHCPDWTGGQTKVLSRLTFLYETAADLNESYSGRKYHFGFGSHEVDYLNCRPEAPEPAPPKTRTRT